MKSLLAIVRTLALVSLVSQAHATAPVASAEPVLLQGLLPGGRAVAAAASTADELPDTVELARAWSFYTAWKGAWMPGHAKPTPEERSAVSAFTGSLQARLPVLSEQERLNRPALDDAAFARVVVVGSPEFQSARQTSGTQALKALAIMGLVEHELDMPEGAPIAFALLQQLSQRTPLDRDISMFHARLALDARRFPEAWRAVRQGLLLTARPSDGDLDFVCFVGSQSAKTQWPEIQAMLRAVARSDAQADAAIARNARLFSDGMSSDWIPRGGTIPATAPAP